MLVHVRKAAKCLTATFLWWSCQLILAQLWGQIALLYEQDKPCLAHTHLRSVMIIIMYACIVLCHPGSYCNDVHIRVVAAAGDNWLDRQPAPRQPSQFLERIDSSKLVHVLCLIQSVNADHTCLPGITHSLNHRHIVNLVHLIMLSLQPNHVFAIADKIVESPDSLPHPAVTTTASCFCCNTHCCF